MDQFDFTVNIPYDDAYSLIYNGETTMLFPIRNDITEDDSNKPFVIDENTLAQYPVGSYTDDSGLRYDVALFWNIVHNMKQSELFPTPYGLKPMMHVNVESKTSFRTFTCRVETIKLLKVVDQPTNWYWVIQLSYL